MNNFNLLIFKECNSTNDLLFDYAKEGAHEGLSILSFNQFKGRGTKNKKWISNKGNIYLSTLIKPKIKKEYWHQFSLIAGLSVLESFVELGIPKEYIKIKWPNDILINFKKVSGILLESINDCLIIGIGINFLSSPVNVSGQFRATKLGNFNCLKFNSIEMITHNVLKKIYSNYIKWIYGTFSLFSNVINNHFAFINENVLFKRKNKLLNGVFLGVNKKGETKILYKNEKINIFSNESLIFKFGETNVPCY